MNWAQEQNADIANIITDAPVTVTIASVGYTMTAAPLVKRKELEPGGFLPDYDYQVSGKQSDFGTLPTPGGIAIIASVSYRIIRVHLDEFGVAVQLDLETVNK